MVQIRFDSLHVDSVKGSSGVFSGTNIQVGWKHTKLTNEGFGRISGEGNSAADAVTIVVAGESKRAKRSRTT